MAVNTDTVDYLDCARTLTKTIRKWDPGVPVCLVTDQTQANDPIYDYYRVLDTVDPTNAWANDWQVYELSPFKETVKLEADMLIVSDISHWWQIFRLRDVVVSTGCRTWQDQPATARHYRAVFDHNHLPDVYNAITYWRYSRTAGEFFTLVRDIFAHWNDFRKLVKFPEDKPSTDLVYALAAQIMGPESVTLPSTVCPQIVHMKRWHSHTQTEDWTRELVWEYNPMRIQTVAQWGAFHYCRKDWHGR